MADASSTEKGAAEEPEPEPGEPPSTTTTTAAAATYDPREYQPAHPDDRGGGGKKATKGKSKGNTKAGEGEGAGEGEDEGRAKGEEDDDSHRCGNCDAPDAKSKCKGCGVEYYCNRECQKVRTRVVDAVGGRVRTWVGSARP